MPMSSLGSGLWDGLPSWDVRLDGRQVGCHCGPFLVVGLLSCARHGQAGLGVACPCPNGHAHAYLTAREREREMLWEAPVVCVSGHVCM